MRVFFENVDLKNTSGPNHFGLKLATQFYKDGLDVVDDERSADVSLCFIQSSRQAVEKPVALRLDGIYFNTRQDYEVMNYNIKRSYDMASGVVFQSNFNKRLINKYFGECEKSTIIRNGADVDMIKGVSPLAAKSLDKYETVWCCASSWRPHKRLNENIRYFLEHSEEKDCLVVAGKVDDIPKIHERVFYVGNLPIKHLISLYKRSRYMLHLAWLDHCPNVVVDARAAGCKIVCSSAGGTIEIAGKDAIVVHEDEWDMSPIDLYDPPKIKFDKIVKNNHDYDYDMGAVSKKYIKFLGGLL